MRNDRLTPPASTRIAAVALMALLAAGAARAEAAPLAASPAPSRWATLDHRGAQPLRRRWVSRSTTASPMNPPWGNQAAFLSHVTSVTMALQRSGQLSATERARLLIAARQSAIGSSLTVKLITFNDFHGYIKGR